ncbi:hypothetical protein NP233_g9770 [Leucocoprinus birnbaumii]|uniref:Uncharacterized protein n=1 Tax=Leucocoprinus birnbaumii TaxID=56174 RepID=A0AAD5VJU3_9AGAR|nr:hypothetical protein NP233_g9770 [Leucocoprinus birnbaumii]
MRRKPCTVDWKASMAKAKSQEIGRRMAELREADESEPRESNLKHYHQAKSDLVNNATQEDRDHYAAEAEEMNRKRNGPPTLEDIFFGQREIIYQLQDSVSDHLGWEPGQSGDAVCYVVAAFRDQTNRIKVDVTFASNKKVNNNNPLALVVTKAYRDHVHKAFKKFANDLLPRHKLDGTVPEVMLTEGGELIFPPVAVEEVAPQIIKELLRRFIIGSWEKSSGLGCPRTADDLPWTELENADGCERYLESYQHFSSLSTFNPDEMTHSELTSLVEAIGGTTGSLVFRRAEPTVRSFVPSPAKSSISSVDDPTRSALQSPGTMPGRDISLENILSVNNNNALDVENSPQPPTLGIRSGAEASSPINNSLASEVLSIDDEAAVSQPLPVTIHLLTIDSTPSPVENPPNIMPIEMALPPDKAVKRRKTTGLRVVHNNEDITTTQNLATPISDLPAALRYSAFISFPKPPLTITASRRGSRSQKAPARADATPRKHSGASRA